MSGLKPGQQMLFAKPLAASRPIQYFGKGADLLGQVLRIEGVGARFLSGEERS